jgi:hypothetical protein
MGARSKGLVCLLALQSRMDELNERIKKGVIREYKPSIS